MSNPTYDRLGTPVQKHQVSFENWANMRRIDSISVMGRNCGRVDIINLSQIGRMTAKDARELGKALLKAADAAQEARTNLDLDIEHNAIMAEAMAKRPTPPSPPPPPPYSR